MAILSARVPGAHIGTYAEAMVGAYFTKLIGQGDTIPFNLTSTDFTAAMLALQAGACTIQADSKVAKGTSGQPCFGKIVQLDDKDGGGALDAAKVAINGIHEFQYTGTLVAGQFAVVNGAGLLIQAPAMASDDIINAGWSSLDDSAIVLPSNVQVIGVADATVDSKYYCLAIIR